MRDGIDLIVGHHAHVVRGVEMTPNGSLIFYGLGNFLHLGTANMTSSGICRDYGLLARVHLRRGGRTASSPSARWRRSRSPTRISGRAG